MQGQVFKIHSDFYYVNNNGSIFECKLRENIKKQKIDVWVGDYVEFENGAISALLNRKNQIRRPHVANIDTLLIVSALKEPELDLIQLNRYLIFAKYYNIQTAICFNKEDLEENLGFEKDIMKLYSELGYDIFFTSAKEETGILPLRKYLKGKLTALAGASGVGKSTLINVLTGENLRRTNIVSDKTKRGTHTTRHVEIVEKDDMKIVDTPGFSQVPFDFLTPEELIKLFDDISIYTKNCKFKNCLHRDEAHCAVIENKDKIGTLRYESYLKFLEEALLYREKIKTISIKKEASFKEHQGKYAPKISTKKREGSRRKLKQTILDELN